MLKRVVLLLGLSFLCGFALQNEPPIKVENFTLEDYNGLMHSLSDYKDARAIVVMFIATQCPVSNAYNGRMNDLYNDYGPKQVAFVAINSNKSESVQEIKDHAAEKGFKFPVLKDWKNAIADKFGATVTPEIYVLNSKLEILYHGRIDNSSREERVTSKDLRIALEEILNSRPVSVSLTKAFGCSIKRIS